MSFGTLCSLLWLFPSSLAARGQPYDVGWTFGDDGFGAYRLEAAEPGIPELAVLDRDNPTLLLALGKRYQVRVVNHAVYPFEVIARGAWAVQDRVLLSMGSSAGAFASDPEVNWQDDGQGTVRFTLTARLFQAMEEGGLTAGYRSRSQAATMRGGFIVTWTPPLTERTARGPIVFALAKEATADPVGPVALPPHRLFVADARTRQSED